MRQLRGRGWPTALAAAAGAVALPLAAGCQRVAAVSRPAPTLTRTVILTPSPLPSPPSPTLPAADGTLVIGPRSGRGTVDLGSTTAAGNQSLVVDATCRGGGRLAVVLAAGIDSRADTVPCAGQAPAAQAFPAYDFTGTVDVTVEGLANQSWTVLVGRRG